MPIYEYRCFFCNVQVERLQRLDDPPPECESCGKSMVKIMSTTGGIVVRESGPAPSGAPCCGQMGGCDNPKRCCESS